MSRTRARRALLAGAVAIAWTASAASQPKRLEHYVGAEIQEPHLWATLTEHDAVIFHDDDFEVFIDPNGDGRGGCTTSTMPSVNTGASTAVGRKASRTSASRRPPSERSGEPGWR